MWVWTCSNQPGLLHEHHSAIVAYEMIRFHEAGYKSSTFNFEPCNGVHDLVDDEVPCYRGEDCNIPYTW